MPRRKAAISRKGLATSASPEVQKMVTELGSKELKEILKSIDPFTSSAGVVAQLRKKILSCIKEDVVSSTEVEDRIRVVHAAMTLQSVRRTRAAKDMPDVEVAMSMSPPVHPDVKFKEFPFFSIQREIVKPTSLIYQPRNFKMECKFQFHLTPQQASSINNSKDNRTNEYSRQLHLRLGLHETTSEQRDTFPPGLLVSVNSRMCQLVDTLQQRPNYKYGMNPIDITDFTMLNPSVSNKVKISATPSYQRFVYAVYLVEKNTTEILLQKLLTKGAQHIPSTKGMIQRKLKEDPECEIAMTCLRVSIVCPLGKMRMKNPCRALTCDHVQCFDAGLYLQMNERIPRWTCPVCDNSAPYEALVIDEYFVDVLRSEKLPTECKEVQLHPDGSWTPLDGDREHAIVVPSTSTQSVSYCNLPSSDDECEVVDVKMEAPKPVRRRKSPSIEEIDLVSSGRSTTSSSPSSDDSRSNSPSILPFKKRKTMRTDSLLPSDSPEIVIDLDSDISDASEDEGPTIVDADGAQLPRESARAQSANYEEPSTSSGSRPRIPPIRIPNPFYTASSTTTTAPRRSTSIDRSNPSSPDSTASIDSQVDSTSMGMAVMNALNSLDDEILNEVADRLIAENNVTTTTAIDSVCSSTASNRDENMAECVGDEEKEQSLVCKEDIPSENDTIEYSLSLEYENDERTDIERSESGKIASDIKTEECSSTSAPERPTTPRKEIAAKLLAKISTPNTAYVFDDEDPEFAAILARNDDPLNLKVDAEVIECDAAEGSSNFGALDLRTAPSGSRTESWKHFPAILCHSRPSGSVIVDNSIEILPSDFEEAWPAETVRSRRRKSPVLPLDVSPAPVLSDDPVD